MSITQHSWFDCAGVRLAASLSPADGKTALLIVSGGNELRAGAHGGMAHLAAEIAAAGHPVLRYDRRGIGESEGSNGSFLSSADDIAAATNHLRALLPQCKNIVAFGNCDAAASLALFGAQASIDRFVLANPWLYDGEEAPSAPAPAALRGHYLDRLRDPAFYRKLLSGGISIRKALGGLRRAASKGETAPMAERFHNSALALGDRAKILLAERDTTARNFRAAWDSGEFAPLREGGQCHLHSLNSSSHSFASPEDHGWLRDRILDALTR